MLCGTVIHSWHDISTRGPAEAFLGAVCPRQAGYESRHDTESAMFYHILLTFDMVTLGIAAEVTR